MRLPAAKAALVAAAMSGGLTACAGTPATDRDAEVMDAGAHDAARDRRDAGAVSPDRGEVVEHSAIGDFSREVLTPLLGPRVELESGYSIHWIRYATEGGESLATIAVPYPLDPPEGGYAVVVNNHGTTGLADECAFAGTVYGSGMAGTFGGRGFVSIAPDYPGLGTDGPHPYLVSRVEGRSALDAARAALSLMRTLGVPSSGRVGVVGLSQGGHATLAAAAEHAVYAPELDVRAFAAAAPASGWLEHWQSGIAFDGPQLVFHALIAYAWTTHYGEPVASPWATSLERRADTLFESACSFPFEGRVPLGLQLGTSRTAIFSDAFLREYASGEWDVFASVGEGFRGSRIGPYAQTAPLRVYQGTADDVIPEAHTAELITALREGGVEVDYEVVDGATHTDLAFGFVAAYERATDSSVAWLRETLYGE